MRSTVPPFKGHPAGFGEMPSSRAISLRVRPSRRATATWRSRTVMPANPVEASEAMLAPTAVCGTATMGALGSSGTSIGTRLIPTTKLQSGDAPGSSRVASDATCIRYSPTACSRCPSPFKCSGRSRHLMRVWCQAFPFTPSSGSFGVARSAASASLVVIACRRSTSALSPASRLSNVTTMRLHFAS